MKNIFLIIAAFLLQINTGLAKGQVVMIDVDGGIGPATAAYIKSGVEYTRENKANALIIQLNTPGGLLESTRDIVSAILESPVPVIVYVAPGGSRAGSAGVFITLAANIAVMAPGTNIGAAHPVGLGGESDSASVMTDKVTNDASAFMRTIAQKRDRNVEWAELTVRESISATENEALEAGAIDMIESDVDSLLVRIDGMTIETAIGEVTLKTANAKIFMLEKNWREEILGILSDPNIAYVFMMLAIYGILFELYNPGAIFPGVIGGISAIIAAYSLQMLPVNLAGLGLILLAIILFIVEIKVTSYGMLTIGGIVALLLGSVMLIDSPFEFMEVSLSVIIPAVLVTVVFFLAIITLGIKAQTRKREGGTEGLRGETGKAIEDIAPGARGNVRVHGEIWKAESKVKINAGSEIIVDSVDKFVLIVKPANNK